MRKITIGFILAITFGFGSGCDSSRNAENRTAEKSQTGNNRSNKTTPVGLAAKSSTDSAELSTGAPTTDIYISDNDFISRAGSSSLLEIELGKVAVKKATRRDIRDFAELMITGHSRLKKQLASLAEHEDDLSMPKKMNQEDQALYQQISKLSGDEFDKEYLAAVINAHEDDQVLYLQTIKNTADEKLKAFAEQRLIIIREHLKMGHDINKQQSQTP